MLFIEYKNYSYINKVNKILNNEEMSSNERE